MEKTKSLDAQHMHLYLNDLLRKLGGIFLLQCNYDINQINIPSTFYYELLLWWSDLRESADSDSGYKYIIWNNKEILIEGKSVFYRHYYENNITYTKDLLFEKTNIESFNTVKGKGLVKKIFLVWTGLRESVPLNLRSTKTDVEVVIGLKNLKCHDYYCHLIKNKYERSKKWAKLQYCAKRMQTNFSAFRNFSVLFDEV